MGSAESGTNLDLTQKFYSPKVIAEMFDVTEYTVRDWIKTGDLKATRLGKGTRAPIRVTESDLQDFANRRYGDKTDEQQPAVD